MEDVAVELVIGIAIAVASVFLGVLVQTYRQRSRLMTVVGELEGSGQQTSANVELPEDAVRLLRNSAFFPEMPTNTSIDDLSLVSEQVGDILRDGPELSENLDLAVENLQAPGLGPSEIFRALAPALDMFFLDVFILNVLFRQPLFEEPSPGDRIVEGVRSDKHDGTFEFDLPGLPTTSIGIQLNDNATIEQRVLPLVRQIEQADVKALRTSLFELSRALMQEIDTARAIGRIIDPILNSYAHWRVEVYVVNYGQTTVFLLPSAMLHERDSTTGGQISVECILTVADDDMNFVPMHSGLPVGPGEVKAVSFVTVRSQREMDNGTDLRSHFELESATAFIEFQYIGSGFRRFRSTKTPRVRFAEGIGEFE